MRAYSDCRAPWSQPFTHVKNYLGERITFYFAFVSYYFEWLLIPALIGLAVFVHQAVVGDPDVVYLPAYGVLVAFWVRGAYLVVIRL